MENNPYKNPYNSPYQQPIHSQPMQRPMGPSPHSGLGIASLIISILAGIGMIASIAAAGILVGDNPDAIPDDDPALVMIGLSIFACGGFMLLALALGFAAFFQSDRNKLFAIIGVIFSLVGIIGVGGLFIIGLLAS